MLNVFHALRYGAGAVGCETAGDDYLSTGIEPAEFKSVVAA